MRRSDWLVGQLPMGMLDDDFFVRFASLFQELATSLLEDVDNVPNVIDLTVAPTAFVRWLGSWIGIASIDSSLPDDLQRRIVRESTQILAWRGTRRGLKQFLELVSGEPAEVDDSGGIFPEGEGGIRPPFVRIRVQSTGWVAEDDFVALINDELPANVAYSVHVRDHQLWPPAGSDQPSPAPPGVPPRPGPSAGGPQLPGSAGDDPTALTPTSVTPTSVTPPSVTPPSVTPPSVTPPSVTPPAVTPPSVPPPSVPPPTPGIGEEPIT